MAQASRDENRIPTLLGVSNVDGITPVPVYADPITHRLLIDSAGGGTVTDVSVVTANGFAGTVATSTTTPAITLSTTITGILQGNGTAISAASTTGTGAVVLANTPTLITPVIGAATGTSLSVTGLLQSATGLVLEETGGGTDTITLQAPASIAASYALTLPVDDGTSGQLLTTDGSGVLSWTTTGAGDVVGPASATDNAIARFDGTTGKLIQNSALIIDDTTGNLTGPAAGFTITGGTGTTAGLTFQTTSGVGASGADMRFKVGNNGATEAMTVLNSGNVGIGIAAPDAPLHIGADVSSSGHLVGLHLGTTAISSPGNGQGAYLAANAAAGFSGTFLQFQRNGSNQLSVASNGLIFTSTGIVNASSSSNASIQVPTTGTTITRDIADANPALIVQQVNASSTGDVLQVKNSSSTLLTVQKGGNVGINNTNPASTFVVGGAGGTNASFELAVSTSLVFQSYNRNTSAYAGLSFDGSTVNFRPGGISANGVTIGTNVLTPLSNDGSALGTTALMWSDLFLASGGVINFNNGNVTLTHSAGVLTLGGTATLALGTNSMTMTGSIAATGARVTKGWFTDIESTNTPTVGGVALPTASSTTTFTNKRITRRLVTVNAPGATPSTNTDNTDIANFTGLAAAITSMSTNLTGTPVDGDLIEFRFTDNATARAITWGASFGSTTITLPTTTVISTMLRVLCEWNGSIWQCIAVA